MTDVATNQQLTAKDFASDQEVRWCPGCGDYAILKSVQRVMPELGVPKENIVFVSGIGCASRFPYYLSTYGFHTIHGRGPAIATGIKLANPNLDVWLVTGDGDALSIGGNHLIHVLRRNVNMQILMFNNEIYGLTKGQYSPTSHVGTKSPSTPQGSIDTPLSACALALGAGARFIARAVDTAKYLSDLLKEAHSYSGTSFVEIFQNCLVFNDGVFNHFTGRSVAPDKQVFVEHGKPLLFGAEQKLGIRLKPDSLELEVVRLGENGITERDILHHDETNKTLASVLIGMEAPQFPVATGVIYRKPDATYESNVYAQVDAAAAANPDVDLGQLLQQGRTWLVVG